MRITSEGGSGPIRTGVLKSPNAMLPPTVSNVEGDIVFLRGHQDNVLDVGHLVTCALLATRR